MLLLAAIVFLYGAGLIESMPSGPGVPENITLTFLSPTSVRVSWATPVEKVDKYDVTFKPTDARVVQVVAGNSEAVTLKDLRADTQYQLTVTTNWGNKRFRSRPVVFRTLEPPQTGGPSSADDDQPHQPTYNPTDFHPPSATVRGVEIGIVLLVLVVWIAAIALFFNRWGKIRMLLPYQPDYKEQLKVPGAGACTAATANTCTHHSNEHTCSQTRLSNQNISREPWPSTSRKRPRINSAIFTSNSGPGFDSVEFFRRHGSQSRLCRKTRSEDNLSQEERRHFGLPMLSISGPSPPEDDSAAEQTDDCL